MYTIIGFLTSITRWLFKITQKRLGDSVKLPNNNYKPIFVYNNKACSNLTLKFSV